MSDEILNTLQELVVSICDRLYADRQIITKQTVQKSVQAHGIWSEQDLVQQIPLYINDWRLNNLRADPSDAQLCKYKADLFNAQQTIQQLRAELIAKDHEIKMLHTRIVQELRGLLDG